MEKRKKKLRLDSTTRHKEESREVKTKVVVSEKKVELRRLVASITRRRGRIDTYLFYPVLTRKLSVLCFFYVLLATAKTPFEEWVSSSVLGLLIWNLIFKKHYGFYLSFWCSFKGREKKRKRNDVKTKDRVLFIRDKSFEKQSLKSFPLLAFAKFSF